MSALGLGGYYESTVCSTCGRTFRKQVADLVVELISDRSVWIADNDSILIASREVDCLDRFVREGALLRPVTAHWRYGNGKVPEMFQIRPTTLLHAYGVRWSTCHCHAVEQLPFTPLQLRRPAEVPSLALLAENSSTILMSPELRDMLAEREPDLEFIAAFWEGDYIEPTRTFAESDWSDLV